MPSVYSDQKIILDRDHVKNLVRILDDRIEIPGKNNYPSLQIQLKFLIQTIKEALLKEEIEYHGIYLSGGAASKIIHPVESSFFSDTVISFNIDLSDTNYFPKITDIILRVLTNFLPRWFKTENTYSSLMDGYIKRIIDMSTVENKWISVSFHDKINNRLNLRFIDTAKNERRFSVESFKIDLVNLLNYLDLDTSEDGLILDKCPPSVTIQCSPWNFFDAHMHLRRKQFSVDEPKVSAGDELLKYCHLLTDEFCCIDENFREVEASLCDNFFAFYQCLYYQNQVIKTYIDTNFYNDSVSKYNFYAQLHNIILVYSSSQSKKEMNLVHVLRTLLTVQFDKMQRSNNWYQGPQGQECYPNTYNQLYLSDLNKYQPRSLQPSKFHGKNYNDTTYYNPYKKVNVSKLSTVC